MNRIRQTVYIYLERHGGIESASLTRSCLHLNAEERQEISRALGAGYSLCRIEVGLGRAVLTVSREISPIGGACQHRASDTDRRTWKQSNRPKQRKLATQEQLRRLVTQEVPVDRSPQQIALWLKVQHPGGPDAQVSHETIYRTLYIQSRGALRSQVRDHLRTQRRFRVSASKTSKGQPGPLSGSVAISECPAKAEGRAVSECWDGGLIEGKKGTCIGTLIERKIRFVMLLRLRTKETSEVVDKLIVQVQIFTKELLRSLTWEPGQASQHTIALAWTLMSACSYAINTVHGKEDQVKMPMSYSGIILPKALFCQITRRSHFI